MSMTQVSTGAIIDVRAFTHRDVDFDWISEHLASISRFGGATGLGVDVDADDLRAVAVSGPYTVAQHSVEVARTLAHWGCSVGTQFYGLLHDAHEAVIGDIPTPILQAMPRETQDWVHATKHKLDGAIFEAAGLLPTVPVPIRHDVRLADRALLIWEAKSLLRGGPVDGFWPRDDLNRFSGTYEVDKRCGARTIQRWQPAVALNAFRFTFWQLKRGKSLRRDPGAVAFL